MRRKHTGFDAGDGDGEISGPQQFGRLLGFLLAFVVGVEIAVLVFQGPSIYMGSTDILLLWGWVAPFPAVWLGWLGAWYAYRIVYNTVQDAFEPDGASARLLLVVMVAGVALAGGVLWIAVKRLGGS